MNSEKGILYTFCLTLLQFSGSAIHFAVDFLSGHRCNNPTLALNIGTLSVIHCNQEGHSSAMALYWTEFFSFSKVDTKNKNCCCYWKLALSWWQCHLKAMKPYVLKNARSTARRVFKFQSRESTNKQPVPLNCFLTFRFSFVTHVFRVLQYSVFSHAT